MQRVGERLFHISFLLMGGGWYYLREAINLRTAIAGGNTVLNNPWNYNYMILWLKMVAEKGKISNPNPSPPSTTLLISSSLTRFMIRSSILIDHIRIRGPGCWKAG